MLTVRLPQVLGERLDKLSTETGRPKSYYVREAIAEYIDDLEDIYLADQALENIRANRDQTYSLDEVMRELELGT